MEQWKSSCFSQIFVWELIPVLRLIHLLIPKWFIYSLPPRSSSAQVKSLPMYLKCQKLWLWFKACLISCLRRLLIRGKECVSQGCLSNSIRRTRYWKREHLSAWRPSATYHHFQIGPGDKTSWPGLLTVKERSQRDETSQRSMRCSAARQAPTGSRRPGRSILHPLRLYALACHPCACVSCKYRA